MTQHRTREDLSPCPFCGCAAERHDIMDEEPANFGGSVIQCTRCLCSTRVFFGEKEGLYEAWNIRATSALQAENERLKKVLEREEKTQCAIIQERDDAEEALSRMYQSVMGEPPEWSSGFGHAAAIADTEEYVQALRQRSRALAAQPVYQWRVGSYWLDTTETFFAVRVQADQETRVLYKESEAPDGRTDWDRLDGVPAAIAQAVAELPDRSSPCDAPDMMLVTADELASIVRAAIDAAMDREGLGNG